MNSLSFWCKSNWFCRNIINKCPDPLFPVTQARSGKICIHFIGFYLDISCFILLHRTDWRWKTSTRQFAYIIRRLRMRAILLSVQQHPGQLSLLGGCNGLLVSRDGPPNPHPPTEEAGVVVVVVEVWIDRWSQALEEGKSAEIWMDDDRRDAEKDEHERGGRR